MVTTRRRLLACYFLIGWFAASTPAGVMVSLAIRENHRPAAPALPPISSKLGPNEVDAHFRGDGKGSFPQSDLGLPDDGRCWQYTNEVSWRVIKCLGTQPESQP